LPFVACAALTTSITLEATSTSPSLITGLPSFSPYLAEDNMLALSLMHQLKTRHVLASHDVALNHIGAMSFADYFWRRVRWIRVRKEMTKVATLLEPFTESVVVGALVAWAAPFPIWLTLIGHFVGWATVDFLVLTSLAPDPAAELAELPHLILAYAARELLALPVWTVAMLGSDVVWRGRRFRVLPDGKAKEVQEPVGATRPRGRFGRWCHGVASGGGEYTSLQRDETS
jgi:ceramide glucosyltransferase